MLDKYSYDYLVDEESETLKAFKPRDGSGFILSERNSGSSKQKEWMTKMPALRGSLHF